MTCQDSSQLCSNSDFYHVGLLWESVLLRYALYCNVVRGRLLIDQQKQSVKIQDLDSGGRGRNFTKSPGAILDREATRRVAGRTPAIKSSHPDQFFPLQIKFLQYALVGHCLLRDGFAGVLRRMLESLLHRYSLVSATGQDTNPLSYPA